MTQKQITRLLNVADAHGECTCLETSTLCPIAKLLAKIISATEQTS